MFFKLIQFIKNKYNYKLKPIFYLNNYNSKKLSYDWEKTNSERIKIINELIKKISGTKYLEIGCDENIVFNQIECSKKVGVDPNKGGTVRDTSDNFFKNNKELFDVVFIDGLHHFEQIIKDFKNSFNVLNDNGYIIMHDLMPRSWLEEHVPRISNDWCGDVWKISFLLNNIKNHKFNLILTDFGLGIFQKKNKEFEFNEADLSNMNFNYYIENYKSLPLINREEFMKKYILS